MSETGESAGDGEGERLELEPNGGDTEGGKVMSDKGDGDDAGEGMESAGN